MPTRGRKWTEEPAIPDRTANDEEEVRILSYNIWFDNQAAQMARTEYLGRVIESCDPDVLCLQEVTLPILFVLQGQAWFEKYSLCAQPSEMELQCGYFCVVMVKKKETVRKTRIEKDGNIARDDEKCETSTELGGFAQGSWKAHKSTFASSIMGRNLQYAYDLGFPRLCVATSHLESWIMENPQLMAEKRKQQLKQSLEHLGGRFEDVIFIGDMNWNDSKDGLCPIEQPWEDAWMKLRPESDGYSYDAKRNTMLRGNLYARFDRAFAKLKNFELQSIQMVGTNPEVNGQTYEKPYIEKGEQKKIKVDVLPSDHYGLLLILKKKSLFDDDDDNGRDGIIDLT
jgi:endonuclease/exonuclease/phosphatase family metal-dependent hydrolase